MQEEMRCGRSKLAAEPNGQSTKHEAQTRSGLVGGGGQVRGSVLSGRISQGGAYTCCCLEPLDGGEVALQPRVYPNKALL
jgi:hypothetical protein